MVGVASDRLGELESLRRLSTLHEMQSVTA
jgi:hypothetical protein